jgi:threonine dehydrogenase-like Zn-dependent dehydrogenase
MRCPQQCVVNKEVQPTVFGNARAYWVVAPGHGQICDIELPERAASEVVVQTLYSGISRGTETLVFRGGVPADQYETMRAPFQQGNFPGPVKYGYLNVGQVVDGDTRLRGRTVFCLYPHQSTYVVPADAVVPVPDAVPARRAVLAGMAETAVNALWDAAPLVGDRVAVVGAGTLGCCLARLLAGIPGVRVQLCDVDTSRAGIAARLGAEFCTPDDATGCCDAVFHTSATAAGLQLGLSLLADEGRVFELSWYGDTPTHVQLGGRFHSARLGIVASQVGMVAPARRGRRRAVDRLGLALELLEDPVFDEVLTGDSPFEELPQVMPRLAAGSLPALCHTVSYPDSR